MNSNFTNENDPCEYSLDIDDSDLHLTLVLRSSSSAHVEPSPYTPNPVTIIPGPAGVFQLSNSICVEPSSSTLNSVRIIPGPSGLVQRAKLLKENVFILDPDGALMSTQEYMQKVVEDVSDDVDFNSGAWGKLEQVVAIVKSCSPNALGDLNVTLKDLSGTVPGTIHYKVLDVGSYEKDITVGAAMILVNVSVFTPKPSKHYLNITKRNVVEVFRKDTNLFMQNLQRMGDHFKSKVDRLLTEFSLEAVTGSVKKCTNSKNKEIVTDVSSDRMDHSIESLPKKLTQCRICHDEDEDSNMEAPSRYGGDSYAVGNFSFVLKYKVIVAMVSFDP
ncbi:15-cis-phytoene desaturase, chloroplastic/chromoplastic [Tanacetum coccineum]